MLNRCTTILLGGAMVTGVNVALSQAPGPVTAFVNVSVIPMDREQVISGQTVLVQGDKIAAIGPVNEIPVPAGAVQVDGRGRYLLPGLADMHAHFSDGIDRPTSLDSFPTATLLLSWLAAGVTTIRDMHSGWPWRGERDRWAAMLRDQVASGKLPGPRIYLAADVDKSSPASVVHSVVGAKAAGYDFLKWHGGSREAYDSMVSTARRVGLPIVGHAQHEGGREAFRSVLADKDVWRSVEHLFGYYYDAAGVFLSFQADSMVPDTTIRRLARETAAAGLWNCPTLLVWKALRNTQSRPTSKSADFEERLVKAMQDAGAGLLLGTDAGVGGAGVKFGEDSLSYFSAFRHQPPSGKVIHSPASAELFALVDAGLTPYQALATGTINVARFLETEDSAGTVAVNKRADLILLGGNPLADIRQIRKLEGVMAAGHWLSRAALDETLRKVRNQTP